MIDLTDNQASQFFHRSYSAVDGLWFIKVEEKYGFETALEIDNEVWKVMPKIQARALISMSKTKKGINALREILEKKFTLEGLNYKTNKLNSNKGFEIVIIECPWLNLMIKSGRKHLSEKVGSVICNTEFAVWALLQYVLLTYIFFIVAEVVRFIVIIIQFQWSPLKSLLHSKLFDPPACD